MKRLVSALMLLAVVVLACTGPGGLAVRTPTSGPTRVSTTAITPPRAATRMPISTATAYPPEATRRTDGAVLHYLPDLPASAQNPAFSPGGQTILFTLFHQGYNAGPAGLYTLPAGGGAPAPLLDEPGQDSVNLPARAGTPRTHATRAASRSWDSTRAADSS